MADSSLAASRLTNLSESRKDWRAVLRVAQIMHGRDFWRIYDEVHEQYQSAYKGYVRAAYGRAGASSEQIMLDVDNYEAQGTIDF